MNPLPKILGVLLVALAAVSPAPGQLYNLKVLTDATPDYHDLESMVRSMTSRWTTPEEKCWAVFYWNHIARRQTTPMELHGLELTDPIRQFNDYGYTMCSTIAGTNCSIWHAMGLKHRYWDIANHTVSEVFYNDRWHIYDNSMSALYTLCDGKTIAGVEDVGKAGACAASGGKVERGHVAKYHCLCATSPQGFLTGADCARSLDEESRCFNPNALKYRHYFFDWDRGHRYILNLRPNEVYTRNFQSLGQERKYFVPNHGRDPDADQNGKSRFKLRGNGLWTFNPKLNPTEVSRTVHQMSGLQALPQGGLQPEKPGLPGEAVFKVDGANVNTSMTIRPSCRRATSADVNAIAVSTTNGLTWKEVWRNDKTGSSSAVIELVDEVNGAYEVLVKVQLLGKTAAADARLENLELETLTMLNSKTQPRLLLGENTVYIGKGDQTGSIVFWPDLQGEAWKPYAVDHKNVVSKPKHPGYMGVLHAEKPKEDAYVVFRLDAPAPLKQLRYGGRLYNRFPKSHIDFLHSFDQGQTWIKTYSLTDTKPPWDVIHYETVKDIPAGAKSVLVKYILSSAAAGTDACSIYAVRLEANHEPPGSPVSIPMEVTYTWDEVQPNRSLVQRSHTELVQNLPHRYKIRVGGADHPVMRSLRVNFQGAVPGVRYGYADGRDAPAEKFVPRWVTYGKNLALGKPYTVSIPSATPWGTGDPEGNRLTDGVIGSPYAGGIAGRSCLCWTQGQKPAITVDLGQPEKCGAFRIHLTGYPFWDAMKGEVQDQAEVLTSLDGKEFVRRGSFDLNLRWRDLAVNHLWPDEETFTGPIFDLDLSQPVPARYVRFKLTSRRFLMASEVQVLDQIQYRPFDLRVALPEE